MTSRCEERLPVERIDRITVPGLHLRIEGGDEVEILPQGIDPARPVALICSSGERSASAASLLQRYGVREVLHVVGGEVPLRRRKGRPIEQPQASPAES
jgi:rhodanese-related sulfurtransferase